MVPGNGIAITVSGATDNPAEEVSGRDRQLWYPATGDDPAPPWFTENAEAPILGREAIAEATASRTSVSSRSEATNSSILARR